MSQRTNWKALYEQSLRAGKAEKAQMQKAMNDWMAQIRHPVPRTEGETTQFVITAVAANDLEMVVGVVSNFTDELAPVMLPKIATYVRGFFASRNVIFSHFAVTEWRVDNGLLYFGQPIASVKTYNESGIDTSLEF